VCVCVCLYEEMGECVGVGRCGRETYSFERVVFEKREVFQEVVWDEVGIGFQALKISRSWKGWRIRHISSRQSTSKRIHCLSLSESDEQIQCDWVVSNAMQWIIQWDLKEKSIEYLKGSEMKGVFGDGKRTDSTCSLNE
jgi:hypothetical protein